MNGHPAAAGDKTGDLIAGDRIATTGEANEQVVDALHPHPVGRSTAGTRQLLHIGEQDRLFRHDIRVSRAHAAMLAEVGLLSADEASAIRQALDEIGAEIEAGEMEFSISLEDVHTHIEPLAESNDGQTVPDAHEADVIRAVVRELTGADPRDVRLRRRDHGGMVALLTVCTDPEQPLRQAHALASEIEERIRRRAPRISDVVVHTEPD